MSRKSNIVAGAGLLTGIFTRLVAEVRKAGGNEEDVHRLTTPEADGIWPKIAELVVGVGSDALKIFKTIKLGTGLKTAIDFANSLKRKGFHVSKWASDILAQPAFTASVSDKETEADLVVLTVEQLTGSRETATTARIFEEAKKLGLELCPAEVGPQLRLQYRDQPKGEWLLIAMEPITGSDGDLSVFDVERVDDGLWLDSDDSDPDFLWDPDDRWVFVCPRK